MKHFWTCPQCNKVLDGNFFVCPSCKEIPTHNKQYTEAMATRQRWFYALALAASFGIACLVGLAVGVVRVGL